MTDDARLTLSSHWEPEADDCRFSLYFREDQSEWRKLPFDALTVEGVDTGDWEEKRDFFEYAVNRELLVQDSQGRTKHVCRAHVAARQILKEGVIPGEFVCPVMNTECPMRAIVEMAGGRSVRLLGALSCSPAREDPPSP